MRRRGHHFRFARFARRTISKRRAITSRERNAKVGSIHINVIRPFPEAAVINALRGKKNVIILDAPTKGWPATIARRATSRGARQANEVTKYGGVLPALKAEETPRISAARNGIGSAISAPNTRSRIRIRHGASKRQRRSQCGDGETYFVLGVDHPTR